MQYYKYPLYFCLKGKFRSKSETPGTVKAGQSNQCLPTATFSYQARPAQHTAHSTQIRSSPAQQQLQKQPAIALGSNTPMVVANGLRLPPLTLLLSLICPRGAGSFFVPPTSVALWAPQWTHQLQPLVGVSVRNTEYPGRAAGAATTESPSAWPARETGVHTRRRALSMSLEPAPLDRR